MSRFRRITLKLVSILHLLVIVFVLFGWLIGISEVLIIHIVFIPLMIIQWRFNNDTCVLTNVENSLREGQVEKEQQQGKFIKSLLAKVFDPLPADEVIKTWLYRVLWTSMMISLARVLCIKL